MYKTTKNIVTIWGFAFVFIVALTTNSTIASTGDWSRRDQFVDPNENQEEIVSTWSGGEWKEKGLEGHFRFIVTRSSVKNAKKLYVQWIFLEEEQESVAYSLSVQELNEFPSYDIEQYVCDEEHECRNVMVVAKQVYENTSHQFKLGLTELGRYQFNL